MQQSLLRCDNLDCSIAPLLNHVCVCVCFVVELQAKKWSELHPEEPKLDYCAISAKPAAQAKNAVHVSTMCQL